MLCLSLCGINALACLSPFCWPPLRERNLQNPRAKWKIHIDLKFGEMGLGNENWIKLDLNCIRQLG